MAILARAATSGSTTTSCCRYRSESRSISGEPLRGSFLGRWNGIFYFVMIGIPVIRDALGLGWPGHALVLAIGVVLTVSTLLSMLDRAWALFKVRRSNR